MSGAAASDDGRGVSDSEGEVRSGSEGGDNVNDVASDTDG